MPTVDEVYDEEREQELLARIIEPHYSAMLRSVHELVGATFPTQAGFRLDDQATRTMLDHAAQQVVRIDDTTKQAIRDLLKIGQERGYSQWELANGVPKDGFPGIDGLFTETWRNRSLTVARNELLEAQHLASHNRYLATGRIDRVQLRDGTGTAPDAPCMDRNGLVVPIVLNTPAPPRLHINCSVVMIPLLRGQEPPLPQPKPEDTRMLPGEEARTQVLEFWEKEFTRRITAAQREVDELTTKVELANKHFDFMATVNSQRFQKGTDEWWEWRRQHVNPALDKANKATQELVAAQKRQREVGDIVRNDIRERWLFQPSKADDVQIAYDRMRPSKVERENWDQGVEWWRRLVGANHGVDTSRFHVSIKRYKGKDERSNFWGYDDSVNMAGFKPGSTRWGQGADYFYGPASTMVHELTHFLELRDPYIARQSVAYYQKRTQGEALVRMIDLFPTGSYSPKEVTRTDAWINPYQGVDYQAGPGHSEVVTMAIQTYLSDPVKLARKDPETFVWIHELLRRRLPDIP